MSAYVLDDKSINQLANTLNYYAEYGLYNVYQTKSAVQSLITFLKIENNQNSTVHGVIYLHEQMANNAAETIAKELYKLNVRAVNFRYNENEDIEFTAFKSTLPYQSLFQSCKSLHCLIYQCSEGNVPEDPLFKHLETIAAAMEHDIVVHTKEYDAAQWA